MANSTKTKAPDNLLENPNSEFIAADNDINDDCKDSADFECEILLKVLNRLKTKPLNSKGNKILANFFVESFVRRPIQMLENSSNVVDINVGTEKQIDSIKTIESKWGERRKNCKIKKRKVAKTEQKPPNKNKTKKIEKSPKKPENPPKSPKLEKEPQKNGIKMTFPEPSKKEFLQNFLKQTEEINAKPNQSKIPSANPIKDVVGPKIPSTDEPKKSDFFGKIQQNSPPSAFRKKRKRSPSDSAEKRPWLRSKTRSSCSSYSYYDTPDYYSTASYSSPRSSKGSSPTKESVDYRRDSNVLILRNIAEEKDLAEETKRVHLAKEIKAECAKYGKLTGIKVFGANSRRKGCVILRYEKDLVAKIALEKLRGRLFNGRKVYAEIMDEKEVVGLNGLFEETVGRAD